MEKPPEEPAQAVSGAEPAVPPTEVTYGQLEGKVGWKSVALLSWQPTPLSPEAKRTETPRAPSWAYALQSLLQDGVSFVYERSWATHTRSGRRTC